MTEYSSAKPAAIAANIVVGFHVLVVVFAIGGGFLVLRNPFVAIAHVPLVLWVGFVNLARRTCPLTPLEKRLRAMAGQKPYDTTWTRKYLEPLLRPCGLPSQLELAAGASILVWNILVYAWVLSRLW